MFAIVTLFFLVVVLAVALLHQERRHRKETRSDREYTGLLTKELGRSRLRERQAEFLLTQAPMMMVPMSLNLGGDAPTPYVYMHPETASRTFRVSRESLGAPVKIRGTMLITTPLMPENCIIFSQNPMPSEAA